ncbi:MAG: hypothetical protein WBP22_03815 [Candidatus Saccharimonas sp.]
METVQVELLVGGSYLVSQTNPLHAEEIEQLENLFAVSRLEGDSEGLVMSVRFRDDIGPAEPAADIIRFLNKLIELQRLNRSDTRIVTHSIKQDVLDIIESHLAWTPTVGEPSIVGLDDIGIGPGNEVLVVRGSAGFEVVRIHDSNRGFVLATELYSSEPMFGRECSIGVAHEHHPSYYGLGEVDEFPRTFAVHNRTEYRRELVNWLLSQPGRKYDSLATKILRYFPEDFVELSVENSYHGHSRVVVNILAF